MFKQLVDPPPINMHLMQLVEPEQSAATGLWHALNGMGTRINEFDDALQLFWSCWRLKEHSNEHGSLDGHMRGIAWMRIAARSAVMSAYDFQVEMQAANGYLAKSPTIQGYTDKKRLAAARSLFDASFPDISLLRNAAAHIALLTKNDKQRKTHAHRGPYDGYGIKIIGDGETIAAGWLVDFGYQATFNGKMLRMEVTQETRDKLIHVARDYFAAFNLPPPPTRAQRGPKTSD